LTGGFTVTADDGDPSMFGTDVYNEYVQFNKGLCLTFQSSSG